MFSRHSPLKRKHNEYHDPDYPQQEQQSDEDDGTPGCSTHFTYKRRKPGDEINTEKESQSENYLHKVRQVIEREFQKEIVMKQQQLEEIDERLENAKHLLDRLRYGIVSEYYKKQEIPLTAADASTLRGTNSLFDREDRGPQMPLHPSIKKLIGKRPKDLSEVIRSCPKRTAAQNAVQTIRAKSQLQKREERKLKQIIREQGIVIDHSKQNATENDVSSLLTAAAQNSLVSSQNLTATTVKQEKKGKQIANTPSGKSLNAARLNNKIKHLIVVGNTSKYIGNEVERDIKSQAQNLTHKWLVYVQSKESKQPLDRFIKKVRFHLHHSYRPNDVVDIETPPYQVSRRGWGEFPIRVQLFFHPEFHQKPVQLIHNIVLDQTLSGIQTLGAETLLEIWLRELKSANSLDKEVKAEVEIMKKPEIPTKLKTNLMTRSEELMDDNLLDFLNKIESSPCSISADIEKIQPTVMVTEHLGVKLKTPSPEKCKVFPAVQPKSPIKMPPLLEISKNPEKSLAITPTLSNTTVEVPKIPEKSLALTSITTSNITTVSAPTPITSVAVTAEFKTPPLFTNGSLTTKPMTTFVRIPTSSTQVRFINSASVVANNIPPLRPLTPSPLPSTTPAQTLTSTITQKSMILNKDGKIRMPSASVASAVRRTILPIVNSTQANIPYKTSQFPNANKNQIVSVSSSSTLTSSAPKQILQKKLVQLVDSTGKVKYIQMLVAASSASSSMHNLSTSSSVAPKLITMAPSLVKNNTVTNTTQIRNTITTPLLKSPNGAHLMPAMTMKPNIFKIVPESMQTKPQILTFSTTTVGATNTNTVTTAHNQQVQHSITSTTRTIGQITTPAMKTTLRTNNVALPVANKLQKPNGNNSSTNPTKNLVFQKEGKLYIIDPQQMKYKQQQKKQVSLLKPQISLLKQQHQQKLITPPPPPTTVVNFPTDAKPTTTTQLSHSNNNVPHVHFGLKQQRINSINALQLMQMKRVLFEKQFLRQEFANVRSAVEFLLRRLKLVVSKDSLVAVFPFVCHTLQEFHSLTAFKQRACEWLRAKNVSRMLRNHKDLQRLNNTSKETFWTTKEIATFARQYAYTPPIKSLPRPGEQQQTEENGTKDFMDLVKNELKQEHNLQYDTLTDHHKVRKWVDKVWHTLEDYEYNEDQHQIIDIDGIQEEEPKQNRKIYNTANNASSQLFNSSSMDTYLTPPPHLENQCQLVTDICKDLNVKLNHEELDTKLYHPSTQTVLAQCLHLFIEKLLRQSIAVKQEKAATPAVTETICTLMPQDFAKVIATNSEFDFLTNNNFGSATLAECLESSIKQEKS
ncbi:YEATS domain-containing protein 2 [Calliphora vicina]|uniref:YEATS domain-containing protein 2 n=1 Tax=Calliphora vicina TaxID=7373 RepID=UPI00325C327B